MLAWMWRKRNTPPLLVGFQACTTTLKSVWRFLRKLDIVLPEDPTIPLLGIYPEDVPPGKKDTCSTMFIAALFIIPRSWKEPKCPSTEEWIQKMWYIYTMEYYSAIKKWIYEIPRQMDRPGGHHPEWGNPITKELSQYVLSDKWILVQKLRISKIQDAICKIHETQEERRPKCGHSFVLTLQFCPF